MLHNKNSTEHPRGMRAKVSNGRTEGVCVLHSQLRFPYNSCRTSVMIAKLVQWRPSKDLANCSGSSRCGIDQLENSQTKIRPVKFRSCTLNQIM